MWYFCQDIVNVVRYNAVAFLEAEAIILPDLNTFPHIWKCFLGENLADTRSMFIAKRLSDEPTAELGFNPFPSPQ